MRCGPHPCQGDNPSLVWLPPQVDTGQDALDLLGHLGLMFSCCSPAPLGPFPLCSFQPLCPKPGVKGQDSGTQVFHGALSRPQPRKCGPNPAPTWPSAAPGTDTDTKAPAPVPLLLLREREGRGWLRVGHPQLLVAPGEAPEGGWRVRAKAAVRDTSSTGGLWLWQEGREGQSGEWSICSAGGLSLPYLHPRGWK